MPLTPPPRKIHVGPLIYRVSLSLADWKKLNAEDMDGDDVDAWGYTHHSTSTILINPDCNQALRRVVLLHEILHACAFAAGALDTRKRPEEEWVVMATAPLLDALRRTPGLAAYLAGG